jgi:hypothetical protein
MPSLGDPLRYKVRGTRRNAFFATYGRIFPACNRGLLRLQHLRGEAQAPSDGRSTDSSPSLTMISRGARGCLVRLAGQEDAYARAVRLWCGCLVNPSLVRWSDVEMGI